MGLTNPLDRFSRCFAVDWRVALGTLSLVLRTLIARFADAWTPDPYLLCPLAARHDVRPLLRAAQDLQILQAGGSTSETTNRESNQLVFSDYLCYFWKDIRFAVVRHSPRETKVSHHQIFLLWSIKSTLPVKDSFSGFRVQFFSGFLAQH
jgi:hypothetical protein